MKISRMKKKQTLNKLMRSLSEMEGDLGCLSGKKPNDGMTNEMRQCDGGVKGRLDVVW